MDEQKIQENRREHEEQATQKRASLLSLQYLDSREVEKTLPLIRDLVSIKDMHLNKVIPLLRGSESQPYRFAVTSETPSSVIRSMSEDYEDRSLVAQFFLISKSGYEALMLRHDPPKETIYDDIVVAKEGDSDTIASVSKTLNSVGSDKVFSYLIEQANKLGASDIHIENQREYIRVRMRIDGKLHPVANLEKDRYRILMAELSSRANVSTAAEEPQSGSLHQEVQKDGETVLLNIRIEVVPTVYGLDSVLRLFNFDSTMLDLDLLGMSDKEKAEIKEMVSHPHGMLLMVGPTGSGKSTTLYSILNALNTSDRKILTLEDPVEFVLPGVSQIPINSTKGHHFADGLRSVLRLDPDVVMVGEIRDADTARTAIQASITGHLVLSSFHANSTAAAFSRMIDLIGQNPIFSSSIRLLIAQRLVRRLYDDTKEEYEPDEATRRWVREVLEGIPPEVEIPNLNTFKLWKPVVSEEVPFGFKGRIPVIEQMVVNDHIQKFIRGEVVDIHVEDIEKAAKETGMLTLMQAGVVAALRGETTLEEVNRAI